MSNLPDLDACRALIIFVVAMMGATIGSFLNVVVYRYKRYRGWAKRKAESDALGAEFKEPRPSGPLMGRSHCMNCGKMIAWHDNIPIFSWLILTGRCRHCGARISGHYLWMEVSMGVVFGVVAALRLI